MRNILTSSSNKIALYPDIALLLSGNTEAHIRVIRTLTFQLVLEGSSISS